LFLAMEYLEGPTLYESLQQSGALPLERALEISIECAGALECAHRRGIVHRDFKPLNVMLGSGAQGAVKVVDLGVARLIEEAGATPTGVVVGTPQYLSPEQCRGELAVAASDQYALGLVLYEMVVGRPAFTADTALRYLYLHQFDTFPPASQVRREP